MSDMPDVYVDGTSYAYITPPDWPSVRYIRADLVAEKDAEIERLTQALADKDKALDQAIAWMGPTDAHLLPSAEYPELAAEIEKRRS